MKNLNLLPVLLILILLFQTSGCTSYHLISREEIVNSNGSESNLKIITDEATYFYRRGDYYITTDSLYGTGVCYQEKNTRYFNTPVALNDITEFSQDRFSFILTTIAVAVIITGIYILSNLDLPVSPDF